MIYYLILGFLLATIGITALKSLEELIVALTEMLKAIISVVIMYCNSKISKMTPENDTKIRAIGFSIDGDEEE